MNKEIFLVGAEAALEGQMYSTISCRSEAALRFLDNNIPLLGELAESPEDRAELRCMFCCFAAAMCDTGDL